MQVAADSKKINTKSGANYTVAAVGNFSDISDYKLEVAGKSRSGKVFMKDVVDFTGMEISFTSIPAGRNTPFVHHHKEDEEAYIFVQGKGRMQVDDDIFDVQEGSVVRVAVDGRRAIGNNSTAPLVYICVQAKTGSLKQYTMEDGVRDDELPKV